MFNFNNIKKLFSYNWSDIIKNIVPKGNFSTISEDAYKDIQNGSIVRIIAIALSKIATVGLAIWTVVKAYKWLYGSEIISYAVSTVLKENMGSYILQIIGAAIIPIALLIYNIIMKNKKQTPWPYFIVLIYSLLQTIYSVWGLFTWFTGLIINPIFSIIGFGSVFMTSLGNVHIAVGCIDFCSKASSEYVPTNNYQQNPQQAQNNYQNGNVVYAQQQVQQQVNSNYTNGQVQQQMPNYQQNPQQAQNNYQNGNVVYAQQQVQPQVNSDYTNGPVQQQMSNYQQNQQQMPNYQQNPQQAQNNYQNGNVVYTQQPVQNQKPQTKYCVHCGKLIGASLSVCPFCNKEF